MAMPHLTYHLRMLIGLCTGQPIGIAICLLFPDNCNDSPWQSDANKPPALDDVSNESHSNIVTAQQFTLYLYCVSCICVCVCGIVPGAPPRNVSAEATSPTTIAVTWLPPPAERSNGRIEYYKLHFVEVGQSDNEATVTTLNQTEMVIDELKKWTAYKVWVLAGTSVGDGPISYPITVRTLEDGTYSHSHSPAPHPLTISNFSPTYPPYIALNLTWDKNTPNLHNSYCNLTFD